jgi:excisionase family DNA binding protein
VDSAKIEGPKMKKIQSDILTVDETAALLKIPRSSVYKLAQQGKIPAKKVGRHWRFYRPKLVKWVAGELTFAMSENSGE